MLERLLASLVVHLPEAPAAWWVAESMLLQALQVHGTRTAHALHTHCRASAHALQRHYRGTAEALHTHCTCTAE